MSHIKINRQHNLDHAAARAAAEKVADHINEKYRLRYRWEGDCLHFERSGIDGRLQVEESEVNMDVRLGLMMLPLKYTIETEIHRYMDELFTTG